MQLAKSSRGCEVSYDIELIDPVSRETIVFDTPHEMRGGTYALNGSREAWLNVTYNFGTHFYRVFGEDGIRSLYGKSGAESIPILSAAIEQLGDETDPDYWKATEGNAKRPLIQLRAMAQLRPDGIWRGD